MSAKPLSSKIRDVVFVILAFFLSLLFTLLSFGVVLESTLFNKTSWIDGMNRSNYFIDKTTEIKDDLRDLTYASGLEENFFDRVVDEIMVTEDIYNYIENYFNGSSTVVDPSAFKQKMTVELEKYIEEKNQKQVKKEQLDKLISEAAHIYTSDASIMAIGSASVYFLAVKKVLPFILAGVLAVSLGLIAVLVFANKWKHRAMRELYYATAGACLANTAAALFLTLSGGARKIYLESRALYNFVVGFTDSVNLIFWIAAALFLLLSVGLFLMYRKLYLKAKKGSSH